MVNETDTRRLFGMRVRIRRQELNWTQENLATRMSGAGYQMHQTTVAKIESGERPTPVEEAATLAEILEIPLADLVSASGNADVDQAEANLAHLRSEAVQLAYRIGKRHQQIAELEAELDRTNQAIEASAKALKLLKGRHADGEHRKAQ